MATTTTSTVVTDPTQNYAGTRASAGGLPNTEVIADALHTTEVALHETSVRPPPELNSQGRRLLTDLENITGDQRRFLEEKNGDNLLQLIMQEGRLAAREMQNDLKTGQFQGIDRDTQRQMAHQTNSVLSEVQSLAMELITSQEFRNELLNLLSCVAEIVQEVTGMDLSKLTESLNSLPDELQDAKERGDMIDTAKSKATEVAAAARDVAREVRNTSTNKPLTEEQQERILKHLRRTVKQITGRQQSQRVVQGIIDLLNTFTGHYAHTANKQQAQAIVNNNAHLDNLARHVQVLVSRFAGEHAVNTLIGHSRALTDLAIRDEKVRSYFIDLRDFIQSALQNPDVYLASGGPGEKQLKALIERGQTLFQEKEVRENFVGIIQSLNEVIRNFMNDPHLVQMQADIRSFINDLITDDQGNIVITKNALNQLKVILVSSLLEKMAIPIPMIQQEDEKMEMEVSNLWLVLKDVLPDMVHLEYREALNIDTSDLRGKGVGVQEHNQIIIHAMNMRYSMKDANIWWRRKKFPKSEDSGHLDMNMPGEGIEIRVVLSLRLQDPQNQIFAVRSVDCDIDKINLHLSGTKHDKIYNAFLKVAKGAIKKRIETAIQEKITDMIGLLNGQVSRQIVHGVASGKGKLLGGVARGIEGVTGVSIQPAASAAREAQVSHERSAVVTSSTVGGVPPPVPAHPHPERAHETVVTTGTKEFIGAPGYVTETTTITTPDGHVTTTTKEGAYTGSV
eukprot:TRINITY_DN11076_c0_g1_i1.p1 TRINITY_DN11076_c0_g1~~TRINITY_DN11076_c0_g1_i1.p1  ORF type:complete len:736 (+),score=221.54 TRINITY_DN11076_c0_g1_i1:59-2266(+)